MSRELDQIDLFAGPADLKSVTEIKPTACPPRTIYSVERLPNGYTRITQNGRVTFNGLMGRASA